MKKKLEKEKVLMGSLVFILIMIFAAIFTYGLSSVLSMEGSFPPNVLAAGNTPAPESAEQAVDYLNELVDGAVEGKPKLDYEGKFEVNKDSLEISGSDTLKAAFLYAADSFDEQLDSNFEPASTDYGESIADIMNIPQIEAEDIVDFKCEYIFYQCQSCSEESEEPLNNCDLCGSVYPYSMKYRDEYTVTLTVIANEKNLNGNFKMRTDEEALALCGDAFANSLEVNDLDVAYEELTVVYKAQRLTDKLTYLDYSKKMKISADTKFIEKYSAVGDITASVEITENNAYTLTWPGISLSEEEVSVEPSGTDNLLATLTCSNPTDYTVTWSSSDESILTVDEEGYFKAGKNAGEAKITASFEFNGQTYTDECLVKVKYSVESSKISDKKIELNVGEEETLTVKISPNKASIKTVTWYSDDEKIATVDENGVVKAIGPGKTTVYSLTDDGFYKSSCEVTVK